MMKDLTSYFSSSSNPKSPSKSSSVRLGYPEIEADSSNLNLDGKIVEKCLRKESKQDENHRKKKRKRRKPSDPEVKKVAQLFSSNLSLISPNTSGSGAIIVNDKSTSSIERVSAIENIKERVSEETNDLFNKQTEDCLIIENNKAEEIDDSQLLTPKMNAFQFLMNSRNNVIGSNSEGNIYKEKTDVHSEDKNKLKARKSLLEEWANKKGAVKRLRDEEDIDLCISNKLEKRAKRLKKMLQVDNNRQFQVSKSKAMKKRIRKISSSGSECSIGAVGSVKTKLTDHIENKESLEMVEEDAQGTMFTKSPAESPIKRKIDSNLHNFFGVIEKIDKEDVIEVFEESQPVSKEVIKIKMFTPPSKKAEAKRQKLKDLPENHSSNEQGKKMKKPKRKKAISASNGEELSQSNPSLNDSLEDFCVTASDSSKRKNKIEAKKQNIGNYNANSRDILELTVKRKKINTIVNNLLSDISDHSITEKKSKLRLTGQKGEKPQDKIPKGDQNFTKKLDDLDLQASGRSLRKRTAVDYKMLVGEEDKIIKVVVKQKITKSLRSKSTKEDSVQKIELSSDGSDSDCGIEEVKTTSKIAPLFLKATPKPKLAKEVIEARQKFLMSGIPDNMKKAVEKQKRNEERDFDVFPAISHIQQKCSSSLWTLPKPALNHNRANLFSFEIKNSQLKCDNLIIRKGPCGVTLDPDIAKITHLKTILRKIKAQNPDYPVYKAFKHVCEKSGKTFLQECDSTKKSPKRHSRKLKRKSKENEGVLDISNSKNSEMWSEKYKPRSSHEILGNYHSVQELKKWLETWKNYSQEINARSRKGANFNSESEFESTDCDSRESTWLPGNTMILYGPNGSGKTSAIYALANELKFNVLELNASTKRTGKKLLQELQEATQSHQVPKSGTSILSKFTSMSKKRNDIPDSQRNSSKKMCILLLEDIDLIFDQDEGFLTSLCQLIITSKRPIILTTTDNSPPHVQKFIDQYECVSFQPLSLHCLAVWLQIVCLVEGMLVDKDHLGNLLEYNKGDIRKTLLEVQFWCQSGGQLARDRTYPIIANSNGSAADVGFKASDDELSVDPIDEDKASSNPFTHKYCLGSFEIFRLNQEYTIPENMNLGTFWWNIPNIFDTQSLSKERLRRQRRLPQTSVTSPCDSSERVLKKKLETALQVYDSMIVADCLQKGSKGQSSNEPVFSSWHFDVLNSIELNERMEECNSLHRDLSDDISHSLLNGSVEAFASIGETRCGVNMALPAASERRWRANQHLCDFYLKGSVPLSYHLERRSTALDYLPTLRNIARSEENRAASNTKRGNRFRHYFKELTIDFKPSTCKLACTVFNFDSFR